MLCVVTGCGKRSRAVGSDWCEAHYMRMYRNGTLDPVPPRGPNVDLTGTTFDLLTVTEWLGRGWWSCECQCGNVVRRSTGALNRAEARKTCGDKRVHYRYATTYNAIHQRLYVDRGSAADFDCVDCGHPAKQWSYDRADPNEMVDPKIGPYSLDLMHYEPRCVSCHKRFDLAYDEPSNPNDRK